MIHTVYMILNSDYIKWMSRVNSRSQLPINRPAVASNGSRPRWGSWAGTTLVVPPMAQRCHTCGGCNVRGRDWRLMKTWVTDWLTVCDSESLCHITIYELQLWLKNRLVFSPGCGLNQTQPMQWNLIWFDLQEKIIGLSSCWLWLWLWLTTSLSLYVFSWRFKPAKQMHWSVVVQVLPLSLFTAISSLCCARLAARTLKGNQGCPLPSHCNYN